MRPITRTELAQLRGSVGYLRAVVRRLVTPVTTPVTADYTVIDTDQVILADASLAVGTLTVTLLPAVDGQRVIVKKVDASATSVTVEGDGAETIEGAANVVLAAQWDDVEVLSDGVQWLVI
jgi:hypothetical protein